MLSGTASVALFPPGARAYNLAISVLTPLSSRNTKFEISISDWFSFQISRFSTTSALSRSLACTVFFISIAQFIANNCPYCALTQRKLQCLFNLHNGYIITANPFLRASTIFFRTSRCNMLSPGYLVPFFRFIPAVAIVKTRKYNVVFRRVRLPVLCDL